ncbi:MAG: diaminopimelate decarboxylase [Candidatus Gracilibacteria bacterium]|nr:diaminopimelate decarboxylase [Candidatus Gracilibacteria bacterium]MDQ7023344.1 diaminopimelate decarboxylase [Candidatus Gracilibacteria bacterium]
MKKIKFIKMTNNMDYGNPNFITQEIGERIEKEFSTPVYVYSESELEKAADDFLAFPNAFGCDTRYAMKANPNINILKIFNKRGILIDASSEYEVYRAVNAGYKYEDISISAQEFPVNAEELIKKGLFFNATSIHQIEEIGKIIKKLSTEGFSPLNNYKIGVRINPGTGDGAFKAISTGGTTSGFGIWHEKIPEIKEIAKRYNLEILKIHIHIGSENTPESWVNSANIGLDFVDIFTNVDTIDLGGGFKKAIMPYEKSADLQSIGKAVSEKFEYFYKNTGRKIKLEVEPGKSLVINSCSILTKVVDIVDTGKEGYEFLRINSGMTDMLRVPMYGIQEPIYIMNSETEKKDYIMIGHCCESGDLLTCKLYEQETLENRKFNKANIGDLVVVDGVGAYNSSMSMKNYNSFPESGELLLRKDGSIVEIRKREKMEEIWRNEIEVV